MIQSKLKKKKQVRCSVLIENNIVKKEINYKHCVMKTIFITIIQIMKIFFLSRRFHVKLARAENVKFEIFLFEFYL